jgi:hypothetical protein
VLASLPDKSGLVTVSKFLGLSPEFYTRKCTAILKLWKVNGCYKVRIDDSPQCPIYEIKEVLEDWTGPRNPTGSS